MLLHRKCISFGALAFSAVFFGADVGAADVNGESKFSIQVSKKSSRANASALDGNVYWPRYKMHAFLDLPAEENIERVEFYLNDEDMLGAPVTVDDLFPYDFYGGEVDSANTFSLSKLALGAHVMTAKVIYADGAGSEVVSARFHILPHGAAPRLSSTRNLFFYDHDLRSDATTPSYLDDAKRVRENNVADGMVWDLMQESPDATVCFFTAQWSQDFANKRSYYNTLAPAVADQLDIGIDVAPASEIMFPVLWPKRVSTSMNETVFAHAPSSACVELATLGVGYHRVDAHFEGQKISATFRIIDGLESLIPENGIED